MLFANHHYRSIEAQVTHIDKQRRRGKGKRVIEATKDKDDIVKNYRQIEKLFRRLQVSTMLTYPRCRR